jgi:hypothetical protein
MSTTKSYFAGMKEAKTNERNDYLDADQKYLLKIVKTHVFETREKGDAYIAEFEIVKTTSTNPKMAPGRTVSWYQSLTKKDIAFGAIKLFCFAALGLDRVKDEEQIKKTNEQIEPLMQESVQKNSFADALVVCETSSRESKTPKMVKQADGTVIAVTSKFTNHSFSPANHWA